MFRQVAKVLAVAEVTARTFLRLVWSLCLGERDRGERLLTILQHYNTCRLYQIGFLQMGGVVPLVYLLNKAEKALTKMQ